VEFVKQGGMVDIREYAKDSSDSGMDSNYKRKLWSSIVIGEKHPWLFSYSESGFTTLEFDYPKVISEIPKSVLKLPNNITFTKSKYTVDRYIVFL